MEDEFTVLAAQVIGAHGVGGNVRLHLVGQEPETTARSLERCSVIRLLPANEGEARNLTLASLRRQPGPKGAWLAHFKEVKDRNAAEELKGGSVYIPESSRAPLPEGEFYVDHLMGLEMVTDTGRPLGRLSEVIYSPANDVYETDKGILIPAVEAFIIAIDREAGRITVRDMPGLTDDA